MRGGGQISFTPTKKASAMLKLATSRSFGFNAEIFRNAERGKCFHTYKKEQPVSRGDARCFRPAVFPHC